MADEADRAQPREKAFLDESLRLQAERAAVKETPFEIQGRRVCAGCFEPIAKKRLKANPDAARCVDCQNEKDRNAKRH